MRLLATPAPPPLAVARLSDDDAIDPRAKAGFAPEVMQTPKHPEEHLLRQFEGLLGIAEQVQPKLVDHSLMVLDELGAGRLVAERTPLEQRALAALNPRPPQGRNRLHGHVLGHSAVTSVE